MRTRYGYDVDKLVERYGVTDGHDLQLIGQAAALRCDCWGEVRELVRKVRSHAAAEVLDRIASHLYHREEWEGGLL